MPSRTSLLHVRPLGYSRHDGDSSSVPARKADALMETRPARIGRRRLLRQGAAAAAILAARPKRALAEPPPETSKLRIVREPSICIAPQYAADELLRGEGFADIEYV